jgi:hypothetical protein
MNTRLSVLALVTLATLAPACDPEPTGSFDDASFRDGEILVPPTTGGGGTIKGTGGHDLPWEVLYTGYERASFEYQQVFIGDIENQAHQFVVDQFLADEGNLAECPWTCEGLGGEWNEGVYVSELRATFETVSLGGDENEGFFWETEAEISAQVGCGCETVE